MAQSLKERVAQAMTEHVAPALEVDGSEIEVIDVTDGIARLRLHGTCASCPSSVMTLIMGLEQELRRHVPEVEFVEVSS
jgi:Fe-S cluster biogenesis protein NfuA